MKILVVDDHVLIRDALRGVLKQLRGDASILEASDCGQTMRLIEQHPDLDLIVLDLNLPDRDGFSVLAELRERYATTAVVVLSGSHDRNKIKLAFDLGAVGFIPKTTDREVMLNALQLMFSGGTYIPKEILGGEVSSSRRLGVRRPATDPVRITCRSRLNRATARSAWPHDARKKQ